MIYKQQEQPHQALECFQAICDMPPPPLSQADVWFLVRAPRRVRHRRPSTHATPPPPLQPATGLRATRQPPAWHHERRWAPRTHARTHACAPSHPHAAAVASVLGGAQIGSVQETMEPPAPEYAKQAYEHVLHLMQMSADPKFARVYRQLGWVCHKWRLEAPLAPLGSGGRSHVRSRLAGLAGLAHAACVARPTALPRAIAGDPPGPTRP